MASDADAETQNFQYFLSASERRFDNWRQFARLAAATAATARGRGDATDAWGRLREHWDAMLPLEDYWAYPGAGLIGALRGLLEAGDGASLARLAQRISDSLLSHAYRHSPESWDDDAHHDDALDLSEMMPPSLAQPGLTRQKPYFEVLFVSEDPRHAWPQVRRAMRRLRRDGDQFNYETVVVGSFEDAFLGVILNADVQAVVLDDGFVYESQHSLPMLRAELERHLDCDPSALDPATLATTLARAIKGLRPELDVYLLSDQRVEHLAGTDEAAALRRIFYSVEELLEVHLSILDGVADRYSTPFFDNLKHYAQRPVGTFHALPVARGKSVFKSNWIRDMGEFYGETLFLAESSATTGGLDSLLEPTGNIRVAQQKSARAFGADHCFFVTNGTSTANKIVGQAVVRPGEIVLIDRDCHKSHHYGLVLAGGQPYYIDAYPLKQYSMYGDVPLRRIKEALLRLKAEGKLDRVRMLVLTNCTFDGHVAHTQRFMEECLAIKPDLVFLWDEAWFGFARFSPYLRPRTGLGATARLREMLRSPAYRERYAKWKAGFGAIDPASRKALDSRLLPDPDAVKLRVYQTISVHKSMSSLRQGSVVNVCDEEWPEVEAAFHESFFTHTSTSPNLQIIASLDVARRQMELEGYGLVRNAVQLAIQLRREISTHPLISKYFSVLSPADLIPAEYRQSGFTSYIGAGTTWQSIVKSIREDEFFLDPTRVTLLCGHAGFDGAQFRGILTDEHDIQVNKTSRNSVLVQLNINNTRSDLAHLIKALADICRGIEARLAGGGAPARAEFDARVKSLMEDVPDLPDFSRFHDAFRDDPDSETPEGHMREAFYMAYDAANCEHVKLASKELDQRLARGPELVSANFVIPYPPGFPIMVPGQIITKEIITFMRKLDVKEIHGYDSRLGLRLLRPDALAAHAARRSRPARKAAAARPAAARGKARRKAR
jgi:arginine decarboxylase